LAFKDAFKIPCTYQAPQRVTANYAKLGYLLKKGKEEKDEEQQKREIKRDENMIVSPTPSSTTATVIVPPLQALQLFSKKSNKGHNDSEQEIADMVQENNQEQICMKDIVTQLKRLSKENKRLRALNETRNNKIQALEEKGKMMERENLELAKSNAKFEQNKKIMDKFCNKKMKELEGKQRIQERCVFVAQGA